MNTSIMDFGRHVIRNTGIVFLIVTSIMSSFFIENDDRIISLEGKWTFALDSLDVGITDQWYEKDFERVLQLPGTLDDAGVGEPSKLMDGNRDYVFNHLARKHMYVVPENSRDTSKLE